MNTCKDCGYWHQDVHLRTGFGYCYAPPNEGIQRRQGDSCMQFRDRAQLPPPTFYEGTIVSERISNELRRLLQERCNMQDEIDRLLDRRAQLEHVHLEDLDRIDDLRAMCERFVTTISKLEKKVADLEDETIRLNDQNNKWFSSYEQAKGERDTNREQLEAERFLSHASSDRCIQLKKELDTAIDEGNVVRAARYAEVTSLSRELDKARAELKDALYVINKCAQCKQSREDVISGRKILER